MSNYRLEQLEQQRDELVLLLEAFIAHERRDWRTFMEEFGKDFYPEARTDDEKESFADCFKYDFGFFARNLLDSIYTQEELWKIQRKRIFERECAEREAQRTEAERKHQEWLASGPEPIRRRILG